MVGRSTRLVSAAAAACEPLERRALLCGVIHTVDGLARVYDGSASVQVLSEDQFPPRVGPENAGINWTNRGSPTNDSDNFNSTFGAAAEAARNVIDQAILNWTRVIVDFNQNGGGNSITLTLSMNATGTGFGAGASVTASSVDNKPRSASINFGRGNDGPDPGTDGDGIGYFIDPTPFEHSEFLDTTFNGYAAQADITSPAFLLNDFMTVADHEIGHAVGLIGLPAIVNRTTDTNVADTTTGPMFGVANAGNYFRYDGADGSRVLWTGHDTAAAPSNNANAPQHIAPGTYTNPSSGITYTGARDLMNAYYSSSIRTLVNPQHTAMLADALGYTVADPEDFGTFYNHRLDDGRIIMRGHNNAGAGNDFFSISRNGSFLNTSVGLGQAPAGTGSGGVFLMSYFIDGNTRVRMWGDTGVDTFNVAPVSLPVAIDGFLPGGTSTADDIVNLSGTGNAESLLVSTNNAIAGGGHNVTGISNVRRLFMDMGTGADTVNVSALTIPTTVAGGAGNDIVNLGTNALDVAGIAATVTFNGQNDNDTMNVGAGNADALIANALFNGDAGLNNLVFNDASIIYLASYDIGPSAVTRQGFFSPCTVSYLNTSEIIIHCGSDHDTVVRRPGVSPIVRAFGNGGNDSFTEAVVAPISSSAFNGGPGINSITFDGSNEAIGRSWQFQTDRVIYSGAINYLTTQFASVAVLAGSGNDTFSFQPALFSQAITADGGGGDDSFNTGGSRIPNLTVRGGTAGFDTLGVDDRSLLANLDSADLFPDRYVRYREPQVGDPGEFYTVNYGGFESITAWRRPAQVIVNVYGTSPDVLPTHSTVLNGDTSDSVVNIHARDAAGNLTLASNLTVNAGGTTAADNIFIHASGAQPGNYRFYNRFINSVANVDGLGAGYLTVDNLFDSITFNAGTGADTFAFDSYRSGNAVAINGGGGDDTMNLVPGGKDLGTITSIGSFNFDGGPGADTFTVTNENSASGYAYFVSNATISTIRIAGGQPQLGFGAASTEAMNVRGSQLADQYQAFFTDIGQRLEFAGLNGNDSYTFGGLIGTTLQLFRGPIFIDGGGGQDNIQLRDEETTAAHTFHIAADSVGAFAGDNLFGPGGSLRFTNIAGTLSFNGGPGAETVYVRPNATAAITVNANDPGSAPGDRLFLALAAAQNASITGTAANGSVTSSNLRPLTYTGFETGPTVDAVAPAVIDADINVDGAGFALVGGGQQSIDVNFSENVSGLISPSSLVLQNLTTGQTIPAANIAVTYATATNTARFTFPGFVNGVLPDGNYQGTVLAGLPDFFGNGLPSNVNFDFFFLNGDADRDRTAGIGDFAVLAANFNQAGAFSDGDFNYSGTVEIGDFAILATKFNTSLPAARSAPANVTASAPANTGMESSYGAPRTVFADRIIDDEVLSLMI